MYACDFADHAAAILTAVVQEAGPKGSPQPWTMLLDLYQILGKRKEFEDLAMQFAMNFERSPPLWNDAQAINEPQRKQPRETKDYFALTGNVKGGPKAEIDNLLTFATARGGVRLDPSKLSGIDDELAGPLTEALVRLRKENIKVWFSNLNHLMTLAKRTINENQTACNCWLLMFELYMRQGMQEEFEEFSLSYAVAFEVSPPAWENIAPLPSAPDNDTPDPPPQQTALAKQTAQPQPEGLVLKGVLSLTNPEQLQQLVNYAANRQEVLVNMAGLLRLDFKCVRPFMETLTALHHAGKRIALADVNEMLLPLLEAIGADKVATLLRRRIA